MKNNELTLFGQVKSLTNALILKSEEDAWLLLKELQSSSFSLPADLIFKDWNKLELRLEGPIWDSSLTPSIFPVFQNLQNVINHAYAEAVYGNKNKRLTAEERDLLEIIISVRSGSSLSEIKVALTEFAKAAAKKMTKNQLFVLALLIILSVTGYVVYKGYLENTKEIRLHELDSDEKKAILHGMQEMSKEETERVKLFTDALSKNPVASAIREEIEDLHQSLLKASTKAEKTTANGVPITKDIARELIKSKRQKPEPTQINGLFKILNINWDSSNEITLSRVSDGLVVKAAFDLMWLPQEAKDIMMNAEWKAGDKVFKANINARISPDGRIVNAELVRVAKPDTRSDETKEVVEKD